MSTDHMSALHSLVVRSDILHAVVEVRYEYT